MIALAAAADSAAAQGAASPAPSAAPAAGGNGPIDATSDSLETIDAQHLLIYHDNVEVLQNGKRLVCDQLRVYFTGSAAPSTGAAKPAPKRASTPGGPGDPGSDWGTVDHMIADGHVYFVGQNQTARGEHRPL